MQFTPSPFYQLRVKGSLNDSQICLAYRRENNLRLRELTIALRGVPVSHRRTLTEAGKHRQPLSFARSPYKERVTEPINL